MLLYHYTAISLLDQILREGLRRGDVPLTPTTGEEAVWLTTDQCPKGHGLTDGGTLSSEILARIERESGQRFPKGLRMPDKRRVRIEIKIPSRDRRLKEWLPYARKRLSADWLKTLIETGGGKAKARTWFIYHGVIDPLLFRTVEVRNNAGLFVPMTDSDREEARSKATPN